MKLFGNHCWDALEPFHLPGSSHCVPQPRTTGGDWAELSSLQLLALVSLGQVGAPRRECTVASDEAFVRTVKTMWNKTVNKTLSLSCGQGGSVCTCVSSPVWKCMWVHMHVCVG